MVIEPEQSEIIDLPSCQFKAKVHQEIFLLAVLQSIKGQLKDLFRNEDPGQVINHGC